VELARVRILHTWWPQRSPLNREASARRLTPDRIVDQQPAWWPPPGRPRRLPAGRGPVCARSCCAGLAAGGIRWARKRSRFVASFSKVGDRFEELAGGLVKSPVGMNPRFPAKPQRSAEPQPHTATRATIPLMTGTKVRLVRGRKLNANLEPSWKPELRTGFRTGAGTGRSSGCPAAARRSNDSVAIPIWVPEAGSPLRQTELSCRRPCRGCVPSPFSVAECPAARRASPGRITRDRAAAGPGAENGLSWACFGVMVVRSHCCHRQLQAPLSGFPTYRAPVLGGARRRSRLWWDLGEGHRLALQDREP